MYFQKLDMEDGLDPNDDRDARRKIERNRSQDNIKTGFSLLHRFLKKKLYLLKHTKLHTQYNIYKRHNQVLDFIFC